MSYTAEALENLMNTRGISAAQLSDRSGIAESKISRWRRADQVFVSEEDHEALAKVLCENDREAASLLGAQLRDRLHGPGAGLIDVSIAERVLRDAPVRYGTKLPPDLDEAFEVLRTSVMHDPQLRRILEALADMFRP
jgi:transcriptional regulator with XRE-family HTH domain